MKNENFLSTKKDTFAICTSPMICLVCPLSFVNLFLKFFLGITVVPREIEDNAMLMQNFGGHTRGIMGDVPISLCIILSDEK